MTQEMMTQKPFESGKTAGVKPRVFLLFSVTQKYNNDDKVNSTMFAKYFVIVI